MPGGGGGPCFRAFKWTGDAEAFGAASARVERVIVKVVEGYMCMWAGVLLLLVGREATQPRVVWDTVALAVDEAAHEGELDMVWHDIGRASDLALLEKELEVGHTFVLELLQPLVQFHMVLVGARVVILTTTGLPPESFCFLEGAIDLCIQQAIPLGCKRVELDCEDAWLDA